MDDLETVKTFAANRKLTFPLLSDPDRIATKAFGVYDPGNNTGWPAVYVLSKGGKVVFRSITDNYRKRPPASLLLAKLDAL